MIDFKKLSARISNNQTINPSEIFMALPSKNIKYSYLRNVQAEVLDQWFEQRTNKDNIIKMNTGSGKTTVALLILKSCLAEQNGHAAYVVPDNYLVKQVINEANGLGISVTTSEEDICFLSGDAILVINIQKLFNGKSVFGMRLSGNVSLDYILIDDVHACVDDVKAQFSIKLNGKDEVAQQIFNLYKEDLKSQNEKKYLEIKSGDPNSGCMSVPFWRIHDTKSELLNILYAHKDENPIKFNFPLIGDILEYCNCTFTNYGVEIEPYAIPISMITAFNNAKRRIFMSATLCDDSQLVSVFDIDKNIKIISPRLASDIGDRMILFPQAYTPQITDEDLKNKLKEYSSKCNVVVIVPSNYRSEFWKDVTSDIYTAFNIVDGVKKMRSQKNGLYVLVNKYDGIDLPDDACRIIVLDGLPDARTALEKLNEDYLQGSVNSNKEKIQKIEQGMGRGIRSNNDYCGIIIMGAALVHILYSQNAVSYFSMATQKQYEVSSLLAQDLKGKSLDEIFSTLDYCIEQNKDWVELSKKALSDVKYDTELKVEPYLFVLRKAFNKVLFEQNYSEAVRYINDLVNEVNDPIYKGYLMLQESKYYQFIDPTESQKILSSAQIFNHHILKPASGVKKINDLKTIKPQAQQIIDIFGEKEVNDYVIAINAVVENLVFAPNSYKKFERAFAKLGYLLGLNTSQPDNEYNKGPDVLWYLGNLNYAVIECKNEAVAEYISKDYCEQLLHSVSWFKNNFEADCTCIPVMIYPSNVFDFHASPDENFKMIDEKMLSKLKDNLKRYCLAVSESGALRNISNLSRLLSTFKFTPQYFFATYATGFVVSKHK